MRALLQRVTEGCVRVDQRIVGAIGHGFVALVGVTHSDDQRIADRLASKIAHLRVFDDADGKMNRSLLDVGGAILLISQFTLYADARRGRRPSYTDAARPEQAAPLIDYLAHRLKTEGVSRVEQGIFGAMMRVEIHNDGPVTLWLDTDLLT